jgi:hypothetical protein
MALIADMAVFQCDNCPAIFVCKDEESWELFEATWGECFRHYCPKCRSIPCIARQIEKESADLKEAVKRMNPENAPKPEYAN